MIRKLIGVAILTISLSSCDNDDNESCEPGFAAVRDANGELLNCEPINEDLIEQP